MTQAEYDLRFSNALAAQELAIKFAALMGLKDYCNEAQLIEDGLFWSSVEAFQNKTDGLHTASRAGIMRLSVDSCHKGAIERLGFTLQSL